MPQRALTIATSAVTNAKLANMAAINIQYKLKTERVVGRPYRMKIESTNICNTKCQLCPTGIGLGGREKGKMSFERYTKLIDELKRWLAGDQRKLVEEAIRLYFRRRKLVLERQQASDPELDVAIAELDALLDALTDGGFTRALARRSG